MDPLSITAGTIGIIDVCTRVALYLRNIKKATESIDQDIQTLWDDVNAIGKTSSILKEIYEARLITKEGVSVFEKTKLSETWQNVAEILPKCEVTIRKLQILIEEIQTLGWLKGPKKLEPLVRQLKKLVREDDYLSLRRDLSNYGNTLQMLLSAIQV